MTFRTYADRHPIPAAVLCAGLQFCLTLLILSLGKQFASPEAYGKVKLLAFASTVILPLLLTHALGFWRDVGLNRIKPTGFLAACLLPVLMFASMGVRPPAAGVLGGDLAIQFFNAFGEELLFRGVIFVVLMRLPLWQAITLNGVLFGSMHLIHGYMDGDWSHALVWALMSSFAGMMFAAARASTGSLWLLVGLHMILNLASMYSNIGAAAGLLVLHRVEWATKAVELGLALYLIATATRRGARAQAAA